MMMKMLLTKKSFERGEYPPCKNLAYSYFELNVDIYNHVLITERKRILRTSCQSMKRNNMEKYMTEKQAKNTAKKRESD